jgi:hypothetical protein
MVYQLRTSAKPAGDATVQPTFRATAVLTNPTPHDLVNATVVLRQGAFRYDFSGVNIPRGAQSAVALVHMGSYNLPIRARIPVAVVLDVASGGNTARRVVELVNAHPDGIDLVAGRLTIFRDGQFVHAGDLDDLYHSRNYNKRVQQLGSSFQLHPCQRAFPFASVSRIKAEQEVKHAVPQSLQRTSLKLGRSYEIKVVNSGSTPHQLVVLLPEKPKPLIAPAVTEIPAPPNGELAYTTTITIPVEGSEELDVRFISQSQLAKFAEAAKVPRVANALRRLAVYKQQLAANTDENTRLKFELEQSIIRADALNRVSDGGLADTRRLDREQLRLNDLERLLRKNAREASTIRSELAIFLSGLDVE